MKWEDGVRPLLCILQLQGIGLTLHVPQIMEPISTCTGANGNPAGPTHTRETSPGYFGRRRRLLFGNFASPMGHGAVVTLTLSLLFMLLLSGCVSIYAPLVKDSSYPVDWPDIAPAGQECEGLVGTYVNEGVVRTGDTKLQRALLTQLLDIPGTANEVSLSVKTRKLDKYGDAHSTLEVVPGGDLGARRELHSCFCVRQTLVCGPIRHSGWAVLSLGFGGSQSNVYMSKLTDGSLIMRLQDYHMDLVVIVPIYGASEPWARFNAGHR